MSLFSHYVKNKKKREKIELYESLLLGATYEWIECRTSPIADDGDHDRLLLSMGKYFALLRDAKD